jgi:hypothetical protein
MAYQERSMQGVGAGQETTSGWAIGFTVFAAVMMIVSGAFQFIQGLAAVIEDTFFVVGREYAYELDVTTWGWIHLVGGIIVALAGFALLSGSLWAKIVAIAIAGLSMIVNFMYIPYYPVWSIVIIALNAAVIWAVASYHAEPEAL